MTAPEELIRRAQHAHVESCLQDLIAEDPQMAAILMMSAAVGVLAKAHPGKPTRAQTKLIKANYPAATPALIAERALSPAGVSTLVRTAASVARMALSYSPLSNVQKARSSDLALDVDVLRGAKRNMTTAYRQAVRSGVSEWGSAALMFSAALEEATARGVHPLQSAQALLEMVGIALEAPAPVATTDLPEIEA